MKRQQLFALFSFCASLTAACQPTTLAPPRTGIEFELNAAGRDTLEPDGVFRVEGLDRPLSAHIPVTPLDPSARSQRVELPPGTYSVSYVPVAVTDSLASLRGRQSAKVVTRNPFRVVVSDGRYTKVRVRAVDAADAALGSGSASESALLR